MENTKHTAGPWEFKVSTPEEESKKYNGKNCGANAHVFRKNGKFIYGIETTDTICYMPHWRDNAQNEEQMLTSLHPLLIC
jgi:hypothetical protein